MNPNYDVMTILRIAKYYYIDEMNQQEIALKENIHRTQISRLLKIAREEGFVKIEISAPDSARAYDYSRRLEEKLSLSKVVVTPELPVKKMDAKSADDALAFFGARYIEQWVPKFNRIGVGVGKTLYETALNFSIHPVKHSLDIYAASGHIGTDNPYLQSTIICDRFANA
ncbi:MAG TPA: sugar-binding domain-containing protein, partial [Clostridiales bacterium]|nr:sugar-binding domain-containing protein [Clostridiales bacterium]